MTAETTLEWALDDGVLIRPFIPADAPALHALITANRLHLDRWLRWSSSIASPGDVGELVAMFARKRAEGDGFHSGIWQDGQLAGGVVCWYIHRQNRNAEVGYWLGSAFTGRKLASRAAGAAVDHLFRREGLHRVELQCGVENRASRAVAERLGFRLEGTRRESHWISTRFVDHCVYGMLAREWSPG